LQSLIIAWGGQYGNEIAEADAARRFDGLDRQRSRAHAFFP
jgi:hypothetical protein